MHASKDSEKTANNRQEIANLRRVTVAKTAKNRQQNP